MGERYKTTEVNWAINCTWCETPLSLASHVADSVCTRCHKLLMGAGIEPREIFGRPTDTPLTH